MKLTSKVYCLLLAVVLQTACAASQSCDGVSVDQPPCYCSPGNLRCDADLGNVENSLRSIPNTDREVQIQFGGVNTLTKNSFPVISKRIDLPGNKISRIDDRSLPLEVVELGLYDNRLTEFPTTALENLDNLEALNMTHNDITQLPPDIVNGMAALKKLDLSYNGLVTIDDEAFRGFTGNLSELDVSHNNLINIGESLKYFPSLKKINFDNNEINNIKRDLGLLNTVKLVEFSAANNDIEVIDKETWWRMADSLKSLNLAGNRLQDVPYMAVRFLKSLEIVDLSRNNINRLYNTFPFKFDQLKELYLHNNKIQDIQPIFFYWVSNSLDVLDLSGNRINNVTDETFGYLPQLGSLDLSHNEIRNLHVGQMSFMQRLRNLNLSFNKIKYVPEQIFIGLIHAENIDLSHNEIWDIPTLVFRAVNPTIRTVKIQNNFISKIPAFAFSCLKLMRLEAQCNMISYVDFSAFSNSKFVTYVDLSHNKLTSLPSQLFGSTGRVEELILSHNALSEINPKSLRGIDMMLNTTEGFTLRLDNNNFAVLPSTALKAVPSLTVLDLSNNSIGEIKVDDFAGVYRLRIIDLKNNALASIEDGSFMGLQLDRLDLSGNVGLQSELRPASIRGSVIKELILENIGLIEVPDLDLLDAGVTSLRLQGNSLSDIKNGLLHDGIESLDLANNQFSDVPTHIWSSVPNLKKLDLSQNPIVEIVDNSFRGLANLEELKLKDLLSLRRFDANGLRDLTKLKVLEITGLPINELSISNLCQLQFLESLSIQVTSFSINNQMCDTLSPRLTKFHVTGSDIETVTQAGIIPPYWMETSHSKTADGRGQQVKSFALTNTRVRIFLHNICCNTFIFILCKLWR